MSALYIVLGILGVVAYLNIGYFWSKISWKTWLKKRRSVAALFCFPINYKLDKIGYEEWKPDPDYPLTQKISRECQPNIAEWSTEKSYVGTMTFIWPFKFVFNLTMLTGLVGWEVIKAIPRLTVYPASRLLRENKPSNKSK